MIIEYNIIFALYETKNGKCFCGIVKKRKNGKVFEYIIVIFMNPFSHYVFFQV